MSDDYISDDYICDGYTSDDYTGDDNISDDFIRSTLHLPEDSRSSAFAMAGPASPRRTSLATLLLLTQSSLITHVEALHVLADHH
jgi:hypothetical protein